MSVLIKNGRIVTAVDDYHADIFINGSQVTLIGKDLVIEADKQIDAAGKLVIPGGIDPHTHLELPFGGTTTSDTFETGTRAAAYGGTTCIIDFAVQTRGTSTLKALDDWHAKAQSKTAVDYAFHMIVTDMPQERIGEMRSLADNGITSYKLFMAYPGALLSDDATIFRAMRKAGEDGTLVCMHAENGIVIDELVKIALAERKVEPKYHALTRPTRLEAEGVHRALAIAEVARAPVYIVHLSCYDALHELRMAQARGVMAHAETCPQYLLLDVDRYDEPGFDGAKYVLTPPLREKWNHDELWGGLRSHALDVISTDHCPFCLKEQKELGRNDFSKIPNGGPGIESRMSLIYHYGVSKGHISLNRFVELTSTAPAKIFGLFPKKGTIAVGSDADIVIFDPAREETISAFNPHTHHMNIDYSAYEGFKVKGYTETVVSRGKVVIEKANMSAVPAMAPSSNDGLWRTIREHPRQYGARRARAACLARFTGASFVLTLEQSSHDLHHGAAPMTAETTATARLTSDPVVPEQLRADIAKLFDTLAGGGFGIVPLDVAYAVVATTPGGIRRIFETKRRSYDKPSGMFGNWRMSGEIHLMDETRHAMVRDIVEQEQHPVFGRGAVPRRPSAVCRSRSVRAEELVQGRHAGHAAQRRPVSRRHRRWRDRSRHRGIWFVRQPVAHRQQIPLSGYRAGHSRRRCNFLRLRPIEIRTS